MIELIDRFRERVSVEGIISANLQPADLQLLLSSMYSNFVGRIKPPELLKRYNESRFVEICGVPQKELIKLDILCYGSLPPQFESVEFSSVAPLGTNSILSHVSQNIVMSGVRNVEVVADPTTIIALECASRRRDGFEDQSHLATSMRCLRLQPFEKESGFTPHFRVFALGSSDRYTKETARNLMHIHLNSVLTILDHLNNLANNSINKITVYVSDIALTEKIIDRFSVDRRSLGKHSQDKNFNLFDSLPIKGSTVVASIIADSPYALRQFPSSLQRLQAFERDILQRLKSIHPNVKFLFDLGRVAGIGYYSGPCYKVTCVTNDNIEIPIADGGFSDWVAKILSNNRELFFSSGIGIELFYKTFIDQQ